MSLTLAIAVFRRPVRRIVFRFSGIVVLWFPKRSAAPDSGLLSKRDFLRLLRCVWMLGSPIHLKFRKQAPTQTILWQHSTNSRLDQPLRLILAYFSSRGRTYSAGIASMAVIQLGFWLGPGKLHPGGINDDYEIPSILMWGEIWAMFTAQNYCCTRSDTPERLPSGIDKDPSPTTQCGLAREAFSLFGQFQVASLVMPRWTLTQIELAGPMGFEPTTSDVTGRRSNRAELRPRPNHSF